MHYFSEVKMYDSRECPKCVVISWQLIAALNSASLVSFWRRPILAIC